MLGIWRELVHHQYLVLKYFDSLASLRISVTPLEIGSRRMVSYRLEAEMR
jgi:hypothetical protein